jgi:hypothetical protein
MVVFRANLNGLKKIFLYPYMLIRKKRIPGPMQFRYYVIYLTNKNNLI